MSPSAVDISVVVPCFRGETSLPELCSRLIRTLEARQASFEVILVDDSARPTLWAVIEGLAQSDARIVGVRLMRNFGQHNATVCGFRHARGRWVVTLDEDLQNPPEEIGTLLARAEEADADVVYGLPRVRQGPGWRSLASRLIMVIPRKVMRVGFDISAFRLISGRVAAEVSRSERHDIILDIYLSWVTDRITATEVRHDHPDGLRSSYTLSRLMTVFFNLLFNYATFPLRLASIGGFFLSVLSAIAGVFVLYSRITGHITVPGWASLAVAVLFSSGVTLLGVGILSEYVARIFLQINQKPQSVVRQSTSASRLASAETLTEPARQESLHGHR
ncbi:undecaprenol glycosyltransferase [Myxococcus stipitatus DSM 14675]|uniref:Undecaprenol glycosyltransferase n=1 Tax=Myxococcus stipitatus (strain DSM 14675 / JCM 12634 / Mx s8) TaxID=1278073 RepID=L7UJC8_MYXSD|nr:glycosyltransferase family 2 protein [Myxococcus stipitatus]AGC47647.1 undecaprenol glycosyltransferase [Myxococcus stipitatus DSM 14675]